MISLEMKEQLEAMLQADLGMCDLTSAIVPERKCSAEIRAKEPCIIAGLEEACYLFGLKGVKYVKKAKDGCKVRKNAVVLELRGLNRGIMNVERTALNVLSRMSAVATACNEAKKVVGKKTIVSITRKTMPGFNLFDNKAAELAGIWTHRINLNSFVLLKDNHLVFFKKPSQAVLAARRVYGNEMPIEIEVDSERQALDAISAVPDILMLDNFSPSKAKSTIKKVKKKGFIGNIELSGGINLGNLHKFKNVGADIISMGSLTHSVSGKNFSLSLRK